MGPTLWGIVGRRAGAQGGFAYSSAMRESNIVWSREELDAFLANPAAKVPGTYMPFAGLPNPADRAAIIEYLDRMR